MPVFKSLADLLINLSPRRNRQRSQDQRSTVHPAQPAPSTPPPSRPAGPGHNPFTLGPNTEIDELDEFPTSWSADIAAHPKVPNSYVDTFSSPPGFLPASQHLHTRFSNPIPGPFTRLGDSSPMLDKDQRKDSRDRQDEARLLGARYRDSQAVKIKPGATFHSKNKKPGSSFAFSPRDKLSQNARSSGPVRASGETNQQASFIRRKSPQLDHDFEDSSRPSKRRRPSETSETIDLTASACPAMNGSEQGSPQPAANRKGNRRNRRPESRDAENTVKPAQSSLRPQNDQFSSGDSRDERFTENAAQQRRKMAKSADPRLSQVNGKVTETVHSGYPKKIEIGTKKVGRNRTTFPSDRPHDRISGRESPDELQGDITTHPVPRSLHGKQPQPSREPKFEVRVETPPRKRSPSDIQPTDFSSPPQGTKKAKLSRKISEKKWDTCGFRIGSFNQKCQMREFAPIWSSKEGLELREDVLGRGNKIFIPFQYFRQIFIGQVPSRKIRIQLLKGSVEAGDQLDLEFWTTDAKLNFKKVLDQANVEYISKDSKWMDKAFAKYASQFPQESQVPKKRSLDEQTEDSVPVDAPRAVRRPRLSDCLRDDHGELGNPETGKHAKHRKEPSTYSDTDIGVDIPVKPLGATANPPERETRSSARRTDRKSDQLNGDPTLNGNAKPLFKDDSFRKNWKKPLVYPRNGKKKAEVNLEDRDRLRTDDFLNDNLIAFYMRFLQDHLERTNPEAAKRIYFFNSYFFATLTNTARGDRGINYPGVEKWTRNVDLFSYDYVVVPINENAHWYVAIICNLPSLSLVSADRAKPVETPTLEKDTSNVSENEIHQIQETPEPEVKPDSGNDLKVSGTKNDLTSMSIEAGEDVAQTTKNTDEQHAPHESPECNENSPPLANLSKSTAQKLVQEQAAASQSTTKSMKKKRTGLKLDPNQTTIVTFDSLDAPRSPTIKLLREYICREAASKRGMELDPSEIKGMRARDIPLQPNFWDCGLYLLTYLEKFVQSPDYFIAKVLQRSMDSHDDWPPLGSGLLRDRFGKFLDELYVEQNKSGGPIMADQRPVSFLLGPPLPSREEIAGVDVVHESQPESDPSNSDPATILKSKTDHHTEQSASTADQVQLVPTEKSQNPIENPSKPSADTTLQNDSVPLSKDEPVIQVPASQEEPKFPGTPSPTKKERKRQSQ